MPTKNSSLFVLTVIFIFITSGFHVRGETRTTTTKVELPVTRARVRVTNVVPTDYEGTILSWELKAKGGKVILNLTGAPLIIEELPEKEKANSSPPTGRRGPPYENSPFGYYPRPERWNSSDTWKDRYADAAEAGIRWQKLPIHASWPSIQKSKSDIEKGVFDWSTLDLQYKLAAQSGINIQVEINHTAGNYGPYAKDSNSWMPYDEEAYSKFIKALVERYDGDGVDDIPVEPGIKIKYWQVEHEPDQSGSRRTPESYAGLIKLTYEAVKEADPKAAVIAIGTGENRARTLLPIDRKLQYYERILKELKGSYLDIIDWHFYGDARGSYLKMGQYIPMLRSLLDSYGFHNVEIWVTETATHSGILDDGKKSGQPLPSTYQSEEAQAADLLKRYVYALTLGIKKVFWYTLHEDYVYGEPDNFSRHAGLIYDGRGHNDQGKGVKKKAYYTYKVMTSKLEGSDWNDIKTLSIGPRDVHAYRLLKEGNPVYVIWWDNYEDEEIRKREYNNMWPKPPKVANIPVTPVASWPMDENKGTTLSDRTSNRNKGNIHGATWTKGKRRSALEFDGVNDYVTVKDSSSLDIEEALTLEAWIYPKYDVWPDYAYAISKNKAYVLALAKGKPYMALHDGTGWTVYTYQTVLPLKTWSHIAGTFDGATVKLYLNGLQVYSEKLYWKLNINKNDYELGIGSLINTRGKLKRSFQGVIDEVKIYKGALNEIYDGALK